MSSAPWRRADRRRTQWDSAEHIVGQRARVARSWARTRDRAHRKDPRIGRELPTYFVDRYAFLSVRAGAGWRRHLRVSLPDDGDRNVFLSSVIKPARRLGNWSPAPEQPTDLSTSYADLRCRWAGFGQRTGLPAAATNLADARAMTWGQVMDDSVFYPGPPVFRGATFIDALSPSAASSLLAEAGRHGVIDFFCFMLQVHETMHRHQTGEPLLNEVVQAALWSKFLTEESLWSFQRDEQRCLVRETAVVGKFPVLIDEAAAAGLDTARMINGMGADNAYFACCALASRFDHGLMRYHKYLTQLTDLLAARSDAGAMRDATLSLLF